MQGPRRTTELRPVAAASGGIRNATTAIRGPRLRSGVPQHPGPTRQASATFHISGAGPCLCGPPSTRVRSRRRALTTQGPTGPDRQKLRGRFDGCGAPHASARFRTAGSVRSSARTAALIDRATSSASVGRRTSRPQPQNGCSMGTPVRASRCCICSTTALRAAASTARHPTTSRVNGGSSIRCRSRLTASIFP
jgi:hypothetical protein